MVFEGEEGAIENGGEDEAEGFLTTEVRFPFLGGGVDREIHGASARETETFGLTGSGRGNEIGIAVIDSTASIALTAATATVTMNDGPNVTTVAGRTDRCRYLTASRDVIQIACMIGSPIGHPIESCLIDHRIAHLTVWSTVLSARMGGVRTRLDRSHVWTRLLLSVPLLPAPDLVFLLQLLLPLVHVPHSHLRLHLQLSAVGDSLLLGAIAAIFVLVLCRTSYLTPDCERTGG